MPICSDCSVDLRPQARYCDNCGRLQPRTTANLEHTRHTVKPGSCRTLKPALTEANPPPDARTTMNREPTSKGNGARDFRMLAAFAGIYLGTDIGGTLLLPKEATIAMNIVASCMILALLLLLKFGVDVIVQQRASIVGQPAGSRLIDDF